MRELLETFRLPGEAQPIARITETFAEHFFSFKPRKFLWLKRLPLELTGQPRLPLKMRCTFWPIRSLCSTLICTTHKTGCVGHRHRLGKLICRNA